MIATPSQPSLKGARVPSGLVLVNAKHQQSEFLKHLTDCGIRPIVQDGFGIVDFFPSSYTAIVWIPEAHLISDEESINRKLEKLKRGPFNGLVIAHVTELSKQYFKEVQNLAAIEMNISVIPVSSVQDAAKIIVQLVQNEGRPNPLSQGGKSLNYDKCLLSTLQSFPGVGEKKAADLLKSFPNLLMIYYASTEELQSVIGKSAAKQVKTFLDGKQEEKSKALLNILRIKDDRQ